MAMIEWIKRTKIGLIEVACDGGITSFDQSLSGYLNRLCLNNLSTLEGRLKGVQRRFAFKSRIPIYIDPEHLLLPVVGLRSPNCLLINQRALCSCRKRKGNELELRFASGMKLTISKGRTFAALMEKARLIDEGLQDRM